MKILQLNLLFIILIFSNCASGPTASEKAEAERLYMIKENERRENAVPDSNWVYEEKVNEMSGEKSFFATSFSRNKVEFESPYEGGSRLLITLINRGDGNDLLFRISEGYIQSSRNVRIKFNDQKPINCSYQFPSDGSSDAIFINEPKKIIELLKTSDSAMVEVPFYREGSHIFHFKFHKLVWDHQ